MTDHEDPVAAARAALAADRLDTVLALCRRHAIVDGPDAELLELAAEALARRHDMDGALRRIRRATVVDPDRPQAMARLVEYLRQEGAVSQAANLAARARERWPERKEFVFAQATAQFQRGQWRDGIRRFGSRPATRLLGAVVRDTGKEVWQGWRYRRDRLLLLCDQGHGDTIQGIRFAMALAEGLQTPVFVHAPGPLRRLFADLPGIVTVGGGFRDFDAVHLLWNVAAFLHTPPERLPVQAPYLRPPVDDVPVLARGPGLQVAVAWRGAPAHGGDHLRSCPADVFATLFSVPGCTFHLIQPDAAEDLPRPWPASVRGQGPRLRDFADTAALIAEMDLVISVDTSVAHLAGALGRPTWLLLSRACDWRWGYTSQTTVWYPSVRLWRQERRGDWPALLAEVAAALRSRVLP